MAAVDVSVIVPIHNKAKYLEACLDSVLSQADVTLEVICIDDASDDGSAAVIERYAAANPNLLHLRNSARAGAARSRNRGIEAANGRWVQCTDADDLLPPGALASLKKAAEYADADVARGAVQRLQGGRIDSWPGAPALSERSGSIHALPELWIPWFHTCYLVSRALLMSHQIRYPELIAGEDPVFIARLLTAARRIVVVPSPTYTYRQDERRKPPTRQTLDDYFRHAELVREAYAGQFTPCWNAYRPFIQDDLRLLIRQTSLDDAERARQEDRVSRL
jgi:glycosyltransferase involved in cell wall biosynthesis